MKLQLRKQPIEFNPANHSYRNSVDGTYLTGVSSILNVRAKDFLTPWYLKEAYSYLKSNWDLKKTYSAAEKEELLQNAKGAAKVKSKEAMKFGKAVHLWIEDYTTGKNPKPLEDEAQQACVQKFLVWEKQHEIDWLASEVVVADLELNIAGTLDAVALIDGKLTLVDFKCSKSISDTYFLQLAAYQHMLDPLIEGDRKIEAREIVWIPKDSRPVDGFIVDSKLDFDTETFLYLREIHRYNYYIKNHHNQGYLGVGHYHQ